MKIICVLGSMGSGIDSIYGALERWNSIDFIPVTSVDDIDEQIEKNNDPRSIYLIKPIRRSTYAYVRSKYKNNLVPIIITASERTRILRLLNATPDEELTLNDFAEILLTDETEFDPFSNLKYTREQEEYVFYVPESNWFENDKSLIEALPAVKRFILQATREERT